MMKLGRTELFGMGIALAMSGIAASEVLESLLIPFAPSAAWPTHVALASLGVPIVAGGTWLFRRGGGQPLAWLLLGWLLVASVVGVYSILLTHIVGIPLG
ncbi:hypothetical protein [Burkholderia metallica]|uniref:hypothetical protein n=1 Tax=Burkholderia metallica TaxID=488729 RepID=UPI0012F4E131|nr:hypothetical protein [Burkholderia metallica]MCA8021667.1 hypothetical protein [Burkholderia metallica]